MVEMIFSQLGSCPSRPAIDGRARLFAGVRMEHRNDGGPLRGFLFTRPSHKAECPWTTRCSHRWARIHRPEAAPQRKVNRRPAGRREALPTGRPC